VSGLRRISWGAVFAGTVVAIMVSIMLNLLGVGIGLTTIEPLEEQRPFAGLATGMAIWWVLSSLIALFCGGCVAGRLAGIPRKSEAGLHGVLTWGVSTLVALFLVTTAIGKVIGGAAGFLSGMASTTAQAVASAGGGQPDQAQGGRSLLSRAVDESKELLRHTGKPQLQPEEIKREARQVVATATNAAAQAAQDPSQSDEALDKALDRLLQEGREAASAMDREAVANIIANRTGKTKEESMRMVENWVASYRSATTQMERVREELGQEVRETGQQAASTLSKASLWAFAAIVLSGLVSAAGGWAGRPRELLVRTEATITTTERPLT
jgi:hypothetical protein